MEKQQQEARSTAELFSQYATLLWNWSWLLVLMAVVAGGGAYYISRRQTPVYQASTLLVINGAPNTSDTTYSTIYMSQQLAPTYAQMMTTSPMLNAVAQQLGLTKFPGSVSVSPITNTQLMRVTVTDTDPTRAALLANTLATVFANQLQADQAARYADSKKNLETQMATINQNIQDAATSISKLDQQIADATDQLAVVNLRIQKATANPASVDPATAADDLSTRNQLETNLLQFQSEKSQLQVTQGQYQQSYYYLLQSYEQLKLAEAQSTSSVLQKDPAVPSNYPIQPRPVRTGVLAAIVGLMVAAGIVFLVEFLDDTIRDPQEITRAWGVSILGMIVRFDPGKSKNMLIAMNHPRAPVSEAFRSLRTNLQFASVSTPLHTLVVTSSSPSDGKTTIATNLATVIAQSGRKVVLVDADLRRPKVHKVFSLSNRMGLTDQFIRPDDQLSGIIKTTDIKDLYVITSGSLPPNPSELLGSERMSDLLDELSKQFDTVILDTPPLLAVTDAMVLLQRADGLIMVVKPSVTKRAALRQAIAQIRQMNGNLLGIVVNDVKVESSKYYYYRGYSYTHKYGKGYHDSESATERVTGHGNDRPIDGMADTNPATSPSEVTEK